MPARLKRERILGDATTLRLLGKLTRKWCHCVRCDLSDTRFKVCHIRGTLPCDVLFIGEAPGESEDILGYPFVGDAGHKLDELIREVESEVFPEPEFTHAIINLIGCYPGKDDHGNFNRPHKESVKQCEPHLRGLIELCNPKLLALLGETAGKKLPKDLRLTYKHVHLEHPSSILRKEGPKNSPRDYELHHKRFVLGLKDAILEHVS